MIRRVFTYFSVSFSLLLLSVSSVYSQGKVITGTVMSEDDNLPLPGVTVTVKNTQIGTITDMNGKYSVDVPADADILEFRFIGMITKEIEIGDQTVVDITMKEEVYEVDEVVVTALGIRRETKALGYSLTAVNSEDLTKTGDRSMLNALSGKVAGVNITSASGAPGSSTRIMIRGVSSLSGGNQPLFIIDGVPVSNSQTGSSSINGGTDFGNKINDLNPDDIEDISVIKGASGTALYGSSAANGVIVITTKKGEKDTKSRITINSSVGFEEPLRLVQYQNEYGQGIYGDLVLYENMSWGPAFDDRFKPWGNEVDGAIRVKAYRALKNNVREFFETGRNIQNSVSISGGSEKSTHYLSYSNVNWDGIFPTKSDKYVKHTLSLRNSVQYYKNLKVSISLNYIKKKNSSVPTGQGENSVYNQIMQTPRDISLLELEDIEEIWNNLDNYYSLYTVNPYFILKRNFNRNNEDRLFGSLEFDYEFLGNFNLLWRIGGDVSNEQLKEYESAVIPMGNNEFGSIYNPGEVGESSFYRMSLNSDVLIRYDKQLNNWMINTLAGYSVSERESKQIWTQVVNLSVDDFPNLSNSTEKPSSLENYTKIRKLGVFGQIDLSYKSILFITATARNDWSSTLPLKNNSFFYPGINTGFVFTELFPSAKNVLTFGKIRASWAQVGNDAPAYRIYSYFSRGLHSDGYGYLSYPLADVNSYDVGDVLENSELKNELTNEYEAGMDLRFFNNRIGIDLTFYYKDITDLIWLSPKPYSSGYTNRTENLGKMNNKGYEFLFRIVPVQKRDYEWEFSFNFTRNYNKLISLNNELEEAVLNSIGASGSQQIDFLAIPGYPVGVFKARTVERTEDGKIVVDNNGLPVAAEDLVVYGNSQYKYFGGASSLFRYKNFSVSAHVDVRQGGIMYSRTKDITLWAGTVPVTLYNNRQPFIIPNSVYEISRDENGDPVYAENTIPIDRLKLSDYWGNGGLELDGSSFISKSFVKLREVVLSYSIPKTVYPEWPVHRIDISVIGKNLLLFTPKDQTYIDPEMTTFGNDIGADFGEYGAQPSTRTITFSLKVVL